MPSTRVRINPDRLWQSLMELAKVGATGRGGVCRLALSDADKEARDLFAQWCREAGCSVDVDAVGNMFAQRAGRNAATPAVLTGSHLDTQPNGGRFDGAYGVLAGLEVIRALNDASTETEAAIEVVAWSNEEGTRFAPSMMGSMAYTGALDLQRVYATMDAQGSSYLTALERIGYRGESLGGRSLAAYFEAHIEQGPILEETFNTIGVVTGAQGQSWYDLSLVGQDAHAGSTPMDRRRDALVGAAAVIDAIHRMATSFPPGGCATVGHLTVHPNSRNVIPGRVAMTIEIRHPDDTKRALMDHALRAAVDAAAAKQRLEATLGQVLDQAAVPFDARCIAAVRNAAALEGYPHVELVSGAAHDAVAIARIAPTAMIFVPCAGGISHNEIESATPSDLAAGCQVLLDAMCDMASDGSLTIDCARQGSLRDFVGMTK